MPATRTGEAKRDRDGAVGLKYVGDGSAFPDIPAHDLTDDDLSEVLPLVQAHANGSQDEDAPVLTRTGLRKLLLMSGLYIEAPLTAPAAPETSEG